MHLKNENQAKIASNTIIIINLAENLAAKHERSGKFTVYTFDAHFFFMDFALNSAFSR